VIVGHSERRASHGETDAQVLAKANAAQTAGLTPILCVGEREGEDAEAVLQSQLMGLARYLGDSLVIAYEPVWAIGTGKVATPDIISQRHKFIKSLVQKIAPTLSIQVIYGGSVNPENAAVTLAAEGVDGALVGGASLPPERFLAILAAAR
jgi:triosephosphate isomerase